MIKTGIAKYDIHKTFYYEGARRVGIYGMPELTPVQYIPSRVISFNERSQVSDLSDIWLDTFIDDPEFSHLWNNADRYIPILQRSAGLIGTDFSLFPEMLPGQRIWNCTRNRAMVYYFSTHGIPTIPVASWCTPDDFSWCFDGLPEESSIAISTNGCLTNEYSRNTLALGVEELERRKHPSHIICCGHSIPELEKFGNIIYYPNFSMRRKERICHG